MTQRGWKRNDGTIIKKEVIYNDSIIAKKLLERNAKFPEKRVYFDGNQSYKGMNEKYHFKCDEDHHYDAKLSNVLNPPHYVGCKTCAQNRIGVLFAKEVEQTVKDFNKVHNKFYSYPFINRELKNSHSMITIKCPKHGLFKQRAYCHTSGQGCPSCGMRNYSKKCLTWLDKIMTEENIFIQHALNGGEFRIPLTRYHVDGYCKENNTIYEFHGSWFHGDPNIFDSDVMIYDKTAEERYSATKNKESKILSLGYNLVVMRESEWDKLKISSEN